MLHRSILPAASGRHSSTNHPSDFYQKKSLAAGARVQKKTALPPTPPFLLPIHSRRYTTYSAFYYTTIGSFALHSFTFYYLSDRIQRAPASKASRQTYIRSCCYHRLGACCGNTLSCVREQHTMDRRQTLNTVSPCGHRGLIKESTSEVGLT